MLRNTRDSVDGLILGVDAHFFSHSFGLVGLLVDLSPLPIALGSLHFYN